MTRILITGSDGFVAPYVAEALARAFGHACEIVPTRRRPEPGGGMQALDVVDPAEVDALVARLAPTHLVHLAAISSLPDASADPDLAWRVNLDGTRNIARSIMRHVPDCVLLFASSGQVYGDTAKLGRPLTEDDAMAPTNDYAVTKAAADLALGAASRQGLRCVRFRAFNHTGPGQTESFALPSFAGQIARIEAGRAPPVIRVGNLEAERDVLDVRDVADLYACAAERVDDLPPGTVLNIASGVPHRMRDLLAGLLALSRVPVTVETDPARLRPSDTPLMVGDPSRARQLLGWTPRRSRDEMLADLMAAARARACP